MKRHLIAVVVALGTIFWATTGMEAQSDYGSRLQGANGWLLPVATVILGSDEEKHLGRGSVNAWDLVAPKGSAIYAMAPGAVEYAGCNNAGGYGCWVLLKHTSGYTSAYGHMIDGSIRVQRGQAVDANTLLGQVGWTGMTSFGPHTHFEIRKGGQFQRIDQFFPINQMKQCNLCSVSGQPVAAQGITQAQPQQQQPAQVPTESRLAQLLRTVVQMPVGQLSSAVFVLCMLVGFALWLGNLWVRIIIVSGGSAMIGAAIIAVLLMPVTLVQAGQQAPAVGGGDWEKAYQIVQGSEGWSCTNDGAYTMGGVTQGTYNRWRRLHGLGNADVCVNLTREQAKQVFKDLFWVQSGADRMPWALGLTVVDHYYNTGKVSHLLAQCGTDVACFNQARIADYRSKANCNLYCAGWLNRVSKIRKYTGG